ncbi:MAG: hypothetical protein VB076_12490, partial [Synergistaceae bacterium]|nr:hypothetical protein [Synergistaceae bacterium]
IAGQLLADSLPAPATARATVFVAVSLQPFAKLGGIEILLLETKKAVPSFDGTAFRIAGNNLN